MCASAKILRPSSALVPTRRTTIGTLVFSPVAFRLASQAHTPAAPAAAVKADRALARMDVLTLMQRVADWQWAHFPAASSRHPRGWEVAPLYVGTLALDRLATDRRYQDLMVQRGEANQWAPHSRMYHADDHAVIQAYLELYRVRKDPKMLAPSKARVAPYRSIVCCCTQLVK